MKGVVVMIDNVLRNRLTEWAVNWTNNEKVRYVPELELFIMAATGAIENRNIKGERLGDYQVEFMQSPQGYSQLTLCGMEFLSDYRKMRW